MFTGNVLPCARGLPNVSFEVSNMSKSSKFVQGEESQDAGVRRVDDLLFESLQPSMLHSILRNSGGTKLMVPGSDEVEMKYRNTPQPSIP